MHVTMWPKRSCALDTLMDVQSLARQALSESGRPEEAITVNQRALIDKVRVNTHIDPRALLGRVYRIPRVAPERR